MEEPQRGGSGSDWVAIPTTDELHRATRAALDSVQLAYALCKDLESGIEPSEFMRLYGLLLEAIERADRELVPWLHEYQSVAVDVPFAAPVDRGLPVDLVSMSQAALSAHDLAVGMARYLLDQLRSLDGGRCEIVVRFGYQDDPVFQDDPAFLRRATDLMLGLARHPHITEPYNEASCSYVSATVLRESQQTMKVAGQAAARQRSGIRAELVRTTQTHLPAAPMEPDNSPPNVENPGVRAMAAAYALKKEGKPVTLHAACKRARVDKKNLIKNYNEQVTIIQKLGTPDRIPRKGGRLNRRNRSVDGVYEDEETDED